MSTQRNYPNSPAVLGNQIRLLIDNLNKKNFRSTVDDLRAILDRSSDAAYFLDNILMNVLSTIDPNAPLSANSKNHLKVELLHQDALFDYSPQDHQLAKALRELLEALPDAHRPDFLDQLCSVLQLSHFQELLLSVSLILASDALRAPSLSFLKARCASHGGSWLSSLSSSSSSSSSSSTSSNSSSTTTHSSTHSSSSSLPPSALLSLLHWARHDESVDRSSSRALLAALQPRHAALVAASHAPPSPPAAPMRLFGLFKEGGPALTSSAAALQGLLEQLRPVAASVDEAEVAGMVVAMMMGKAGAPPSLVYSLSAEPKHGAWSAEADGWVLPLLAPLVSEWFAYAHGRKLDWRLVMAQLDHPQLAIDEPKAVGMLIALWNIAAAPPGGGPPEPFPLHEALLGRLWQNSVAQVQFIAVVVRSSHLLGAAIQTPRHLSNLLSIPDADSARTAQNPWCSVDLLETIVRIANNHPDYYNFLHAILEIGLKQSPGVLIIGLAHIRQSHFSGLYADVFSKLMSMMFNAGNHPNTGAILQQLWVINPATLLASLVFLYQQDRAYLPRILQVAHDLAILPVLLKARPFSFALDLATVAALQSLVDLEAWLREQAQAHATPFLHATLMYLCERYNAASDASAPAAQPFDFTPEILQRFLAALAPFADGFDFESRKLVAALRSPQGPIPLPGQSMAAAGQAHGAGQAEKLFPPEIEEQANRYFQQIYTSELSIESAIGLLSHFKNSAVQREQETFSCMIHNLFDEYRFFHKYPEKELEITGKLFGSLIQHQLVTYIPLGIALRYILEALRSSSKKMFSFGVFALQQFVHRLSEWPQYCAHLVQLPHLRSLHPDIMAAVERAAESGIGAEALAAVTIHAAPSSSPPSSADPITSNTPTNTTPIASSQPPSQQRPSSATPPPEKHREPSPPSVTPPSEPEERIAVPDARVQDRVHFIFNNVSMQDLMLSELRQVVVPEFYPWFADYLVAKRACVEENFQPLYLTILKELNVPQVDAAVLATTYRAIRRLFQKAHQEELTTSEKTRLKNLGKWLGSITIACNKPILQRDLDLKDLIVDGFVYNQLDLVLPFVCRVLALVVKSRIDVNNVWIRGLLRLLNEVLRTPNLKLAHTFEIDLLFQALNLDPAAVKVTDTLQHAIKLSQELRNKRSQARGQAPAESPEHPPAASRSASLHIDAEIPLFQLHPQLKRCCPLALDKALREIITPVVDRSATIACITTRELVLKDFPLEGDFAATRTAAHHMAKNLAGNLALVTCKEPLRNTISSHLQTLLVTAINEARLNVTETMLTAAIQQICHDNIDLACSIVEKAATEKALADTDENLNKYLSLQQNSGRRAAANPFSASLPENLRAPTWTFAQTGQVAVSPHHLRVYEDFAKLQTSVMQQQQQLPSAGGASPQPASPTVDQLLALLNELNENIESASAWASSFSQLPQHHEIQTTLKNFVGLFPSLPTEDAALQPISRLFNDLFKSKKKLAQEVYVRILEFLVHRADLGPRAAVISHALTKWLLAQPAPIRKGIWLKLIATSIVQVDAVDKFLSAQLAASPKAFSELGLFLLSRLSEISPEASLLPLSLSQMLAYVHANPDPALSAALGQIHRGKSPVAPPPSLAAPPSGLQKSLVDPEIREQALGLFEEWLQISMLTDAGENQKRSLAFIHTVRRHPLFGFTPDSKLPSLFSTLVESAVAGFKATASRASESDNPQHRLSLYRRIESLSAFMVLTLKAMVQDGPEAPMTRIALLNTMLSAIAQALIADHDAAVASFDQRPYFHLLVCLLEELSAPVEAFMDDFQVRILFTFGNTFSVLSPLRVPGFVFGWLELISKKSFMPKLLINKPPHQAWALFEKVYLDLFKFLEPHLRYAQLTEPIRRLYKGALRVLLVLLHDFPEFLCDYHFVLCDAIPPTCVQMRNLILSAFPRSMRMPDPFTPNLKVDLLPEIAQPPRIFPNYAAVLTTHNNGGLKQLIDRYLQSRPSSPIVHQIIPHLILPSEAVSAGTRYNVPLINSLAVYLGAHAILQNQPKQGSSTPSIARTPSMELFQQLVQELDLEGTYFVLTAIANQLRYPNNHTHYFSFVLLSLFADSTQELLQEQITRVLLERLIVHRPHPWGLLITFIELIKNPRYNFWNKRFVSSAPELKRLFDSVSNICK